MNRCSTARPPAPIFCSNGIGYPHDRRDNVPLEGGELVRRPGLLDSDQPVEVVIASEAGDLVDDVAGLAGLAQRAGRTVNGRVCGQYSASTRRPISRACTTAGDSP